MTTNETVGLTLKEAIAKAEEDVALSEETPTETDIPVPELEALRPVVEQPIVETEAEVGLLDDLVEQEEELETESSEFEVNGELITLEELRNGYMRQADYTVKTQELAERERQAEKWLTFGQLLEERPVETVRKLYQNINKGTDLTEGLGTTTESAPLSDQPVVPQDIGALVEARVAEMLDTDPRLVAIQQDAALAQVNEIFAEIEEGYNVTLADSDKEKILLTATELDTTDLKFVFGGLMNQVQQKQAALANAKSLASTKPELAPDKPIQETDQKYPSFRAAIEATLAEDDYGL